jgi:hypothetical protein
VCITLPDRSAYCTHTLNGKERRISAEEWYTLQVGRISLDLDGYAQYQKFIEEACLKIKCSMEEQRLINAGNEKFEKVLKRVLKTY